MEHKKYNEYIKMPIMELIVQAGNVRRKDKERHMDLCGIVNAKSGKCSEDCRFCAQSAKYGTNVDIYPLLKTSAIIESACAAEKNGAERFGIVTSGNRLLPEEIHLITSAVKAIRKKTGLKVCASLGALDEDYLKELKDAGISRYHHNIETSENHYGNVVSTHAFSDRIATIKAAKRTGLEICSGGIIGIGERWGDRIDMAVTLKELNVDAVPLNFLVPIKGTPFGLFDRMNAYDALRTVALFRIILGPDIRLKIAAGRESVFKDIYGLMFMAGADGIMIGGYLTVKGRSVEDDILLKENITGLWKA